MSLRAKTARNIGIVAVLQVFATVVNTITLIVLARLLTPYDFGIVGIAAFVLGIITQFSDFGLGPAVIQRQKDVDEALYTGGAMRILIALLLFIITFFMAPYAAMLFNAQEVTIVIRIAAVMFFLNSAGFVSNTRLTKELKFGRLAYVAVVLSIVSASSSITLALLGFSYWSMIIGPMIGTACSLVALYIVCPWKFRFRINKRIAKELIAYGKHIFVMVFFVFLIFNLDDAFVAGVLGVVVLGFYTIAYKWSSSIANFLTKIVYRVMFPTYSQIQEDPRRLKVGYVESLDVISMASFPLYFGLIIVAPEFVSIVLGDKWMPAVLALQILCIFGLMRTLAEPAGNVLLAIGKSKVLSFTNFLNFVILIIFIYPATLWFGMEGVALLIVIMYFTHMVLLWWFITKNLDVTLSEIAGSFKVPLLSALVMALIALVVKMVLGFGLLPFLAAIIVGAVVYFAVIYTFAGEKVRFYWREIRKILKMRSRDV
jgi:O-antigen/teichoic acid export membrane protein